MVAPGASSPVQVKISLYRAFKVHRKLLQGVSGSSARGLMETPRSPECGPVSLLTSQPGPRVDLTNGRSVSASGPTHPIRVELS